MPPTSVGSMPVRFEVHPNRSEGTLASSPIVLHTKVCGKRGCSGAIYPVLFHALPSPQAADDGARHSLADPNA